MLGKNVGSWDGKEKKLSGFVGISDGTAVGPLAEKNT